VQAHIRLIASLDRLADVTGGRFPDRARYTQARFRVSHASFTRRTILEDVFRHLLPDATAGDSKALRDLRSTGSAMRLESTAHVSRWTADEIEADWPAYCAASAVLRLRMKARVETERRLVYPLLEQRALR
jgi:hypothetical protein